MLQIPKRATPLQRYLWPVAIVIIVVVAIVAMQRAWHVLTGSAQPTVNIAEVEVGDVVAHVSGRGLLLPRQSFSVMAEVDGVIQELLLYPGAEVTPNDAILTMRNPQLERERERAELAVLEATAALQSGQAKLHREGIALENEISLLEADIRFAKQELETLETLLEQQILARLDYLRSQIALEKSQLRHTLALRNLAAFQQSRAADERALAYRLEEAEKQLAMIEHDINYLQVRAESLGVLNALGDNVEVGKPIRRGDILAQITDPNSLYADVFIAASNASSVVAGQQVQVQIRQHQLQGQVIRVHPSVEQGQIRVEVLVPPELPASSRANLDISVRIITAESPQTLRVATPLNVPADALTTLVFVESQNGFTRREVQLGVVGSEHMEIISGLHAGERILLDVPARLRNQESINFKELTRG